MAWILIADDSIIMRRNLKSILAQKGHSIVAEADRRQGRVLLCNIFIFLGHNGIKT